MGRKKVKLAFIANNTKRITTFRKRKKSLMKKAEELNTLCGIEASRPELDQGRKKVNQESFVSQSIVKGQDKLQKVVKENKEIEMSSFMSQCLNIGNVQPCKNMTTADLNVLSSMIEQDLMDVDKRMEMLNCNQLETPSQLQMQTTPTYKPDMQTLANQPGDQMQTLENQPDMQTLTNQLGDQMQNLAN
ncbi:Agamous-like MADS-box protein AGL80 [Glycine soja]|uniref:Agamous-like MADS-box protein AGL80 n=1 Tax=Glycine soja TaxID=3848 RepID=A0A445I4C2_GLYSO|nr:Agamous-like MADS-box protein AGL80 [Glycine soja]